MDIHKPKPVHSVKEFFSEIIVIVTGIAIALGGEQLVEFVHWQHRVESAEVGLGLELSDSIGQSLERVLFSDCVDARLDSLAALLDEAANSGKLPAIGMIGMPPWRTWNSGTWNSTLAGQTAEHLSTEGRNRYSSLYEFVAVLSRTNNQELDTWTRLYTLVGPGRRIEPSEVALLRAMIGEARMLNQEMGLASVRVQQRADGFILRDEATIQFYNQPKSAYGICKPIGAVPDHYGQAPMANTIERAQASSPGQTSKKGAVFGASDDSAPVKPQ